MHLHDHDDDSTPPPERIHALRRLPYRAYLQTPEWKRRRNRALARASWRCEQPGCTSTESLEVHHRRYDRLGAEPDEDLCVLCYGHHHALHAQAGQLRQLHWRVIRDVINSGAFESFADFVEAVKVRFAALRIHVDPHALNDMLGMSLREVALDAPDHPTRVSVANDPAHISEAEARAILAGLEIDPIPYPSMPGVRELSAAEILERRWRADQRKAYQLIQQQILDTAHRVAALEAVVEAESEHSS